MLNQKYFKGPICSKWQKLSAIDFNYFNFQTKEKKENSFEKIKNNLNNLSKGKKVAINAGHFIPNNENFENIGKNPSKTWSLGCELIKELKENNSQAKISLMLNDIDLTAEAKKEIFENHIKIPGKFLQIMKKFNLSKNDILYCGWNNEEIFTEKKLSNRLDHLIKRNKLDKKYENANNYCVSALIMYFLDLIEQGIDVSVFVMPKCAWHNYKNAVDLFQKLNNAKLNHICYLETPNCFL